MQRLRVEHPVGRVIGCAVGRGQFVGRFLLQLQDVVGVGRIAEGIAAAILSVPPVRGGGNC